MLKWKGEAGGWTVHLKFKVIQYLLLSENALHFLGPKHLLILFFLFGMSVFSPPLPTTYPVFKDSLPSSHETCPDPINQLWSFVCSLVHSTKCILNACYMPDFVLGIKDYMADKTDRRSPAFVDLIFYMERQIKIKHINK